MIEYLSLLMFAVTFLVLVAGYPVAATLAGVGLLFAFIGIVFGIFDATILGFIPSRVFGIVTNQTLIAVPLFVLMGITLERTEIAKTLLESMSRLFSKFPGGLGLAVIIVGMLMAASTGIVGATVVTMGLLALPTLLEKGYDPKLATGTIAATGTLGQIIPPSIALVLLGDVLSNAYQQAQLQQGVFAPKTVSVGDLFAGALIPGIVLVVMYSLFMFFQTTRQKHNSVAVEKTRPKGNSYGLIKGFAPPFILIISVLGSILFGYATPTEAAALGAMGSLFLAALSRNLSFSILHEISQSTMRTTAMVFFILLGASIFSLVFRGFGGDDLVQSFFADMPGGVWGAVAVVMW